MPTIPNVALSSVNTAFEPLPEGEYGCFIKEVEYKDDDPNKPVVIIKMKVDDGGEQQGREFSEFLHLMQNDGKPNEISQKQLKRYYEAVVGPEAANIDNPDTDDLVNGRVRVALVISSYKDKKDIDPETNEPRTKTNNKVKRITAW